ncbi:MAG: TetR/AcrR family transcriptional regulator [Mycobacterium sp.]
MTLADLDSAAASRHGGDGLFRRRLLDGLATSISERGYRETTVADIVRHARTSKRTFYREFPTKEACFTELLWTANEDMIAQIRAAVDPHAEWTDQIRQAIETYVMTIDTRPAITVSWIRELPALGEATRPIQREGFKQLTQLLVDLSSNDGFQRASLAAVTRPTAALLLGGLRELTAITVEDGDDVFGIVDTAVAAIIAILGSQR